MKTTARLMTGFVAPLAFATNAAKDGAPKTDAPVAAGSTPAPVAAASTEAKTPKPRAISEVLGVASDIPMPASIKTRDSSSKYEFDKLEVGQSIGIKGRTAASLRSTVSGQNKKSMEDKRNADGTVVYKMKNLTDADGNVTRVSTGETEKVPGKVFVVADVDSKSDPQGADCRIWRKQ